MSNKKTTKRALVLSIISMLICVTMLVGTTFAWFTDSVTSGVNQILAGNLDVELYHTSKNVTEETKVTETSAPLFKDVTLWEPGAVAYENLTVKNVGTLALKYDLSINFANENTINGNGLSTALSVGVVEDGVSGTREEVVAAVNNWTSLANFVQTGTLLPEGTTTKTYGVVIYWMPKDNDNNWNVNNGQKTDDNDTQLHIDLGVKLFATQDTVEEDSFDEKYDVDAPMMEVATFDELQKSLNAGNSVTLTSDIDASVLTPKNQRVTIPEGVNVTIDLNGYKLTSKDGGGSNIMAIYVSRNANLTLEDSSAAKTGEIVSSCYGIYVQPNAMVTMNGGTVTVTGNNAYDYGVVVWNGKFVMNSGTINAREGVVTSNYWAANGENVMNCNVTIGEDAVINASVIDINTVDAPTTVIVDNR